MHPRPADDRPPGPFQPRAPRAFGWRLPRRAQSPSARGQGDAGATRADTGSRALNSRPGDHGSPPGSKGGGPISAPHSPVPRGPLGRCRHKGDARVTHLVPRGPGSRSASLRAAAMAPPGAGSRVPLPPSASLAQPARPAAQRPFCLPALRPENCALGVGGARARTKRGRGRQNQFARRRPLPSRDAATSMHQDRAGSPLEQSKTGPEGPGLLSDRGVPWSKGCKETA